MAPWINRQLEVMIYSNVSQQTRIDSNQSVFRYDLRRPYKEEQQACNQEKRQRRTTAEQERVEKQRRENILSRLFKRGDRIKIQQGASTTRGVYIRSNDHLLVWADENGHLSTSSIDHIVISKL